MTAKKAKPAEPEASPAQASSDDHEKARAKAEKALRAALADYLTLGSTRHEAHELADQVHDGLHGLNARAAMLDEDAPYPLLGA